jgi:hypothetical protein
MFRKDVFKKTQLYRITDGDHYEDIKLDLENMVIVINAYSKTGVRSA